jgi:aspartate-semialdehyde dehydrogenase
MNVAIVGATGQVGRKMIFCLEKSSLIKKIDNLYLFASKKSATKKLIFNNKQIEVDALENWELYKFDYALFSAGATISKKYAPLFAKKNIICIDNSSAFRNLNKVPLVVSEVNIKDIKNSKIIANPNCTTMAMMPALNVLNKEFTLKRLVISTYQAVSGSGRAGIDELSNQIQKSVKQDIKKLADSNDGIDLGVPNVYKDTIAYNAVAFAGNMLENGYTDEEEKLINESRKILHSPNLKVSGTCVRIPVFSSHALSINAEFKKPVNLQSVKNILSKTKGVNISELASPLKTTGKKGTFVISIRIDISNKNTLNLWIVADNLL